MELRMALPTCPVPMMTIFPRSADIENTPPFQLFEERMGKNTAENAAQHKKVLAIS
jgi:hypothetical protein